MNIYWYLFMSKPYYPSLPKITLSLSYLLQLGHKWVYYVGILNYFCLKTSKDSTHLQVNLNPVLNTHKYFKT